MERYDIIIIGAGISGLSLAHYCAKEGLNTLVIEKSERTGGAFHTSRPDKSEGFWLELGAHTCYNSYCNLIGIIEDCRILDRIVRREKVPFRVMADNRIMSIFSQLNLLELLISAPKIFTLKKKGESIKSYYSRITGKKNFEKVFAPVFNAVISQDANDFPADMLFKKRERRKDIFKKFTFIGGVQTITDEIEARENIRIVTGIEAKKIRFDSGLFSITAGNGAVFESLCLALATPASAAAQILQDSFPEVSQRLSQIKVAAVESMGVVARKTAVSIKPFAGIIPQKNDDFFSIVSRDTIPHNNYRGFTFHFKPGILDHEAKIKRISEALGIKRNELEYIEAKENLVPSLRVGHDRLITEITGLISGKRLFLTGNYFYGMAIEDCITRSLTEFYRLKKEWS